MDWITEQVAIGDYREAQDADLLRSVGFGAVLSLIGTLVGKSPAELGVRELEIIPLLDGADNDLSRFRRAVDALARLVTDAPPVLVHCRAGWSRSPAVVAGYLMQSEGLSVEQALADVSAKRKGSMVPELKTLLVDFGQLIA